MSRHACFRVVIYVFVSQSHVFVCVPGILVCLSRDLHICVLVTYVFISLFAGHVSVPVSGYLHMCVSHTCVYLFLGRTGQYTCLRMFYTRVLVTHVFICWTDRSVYLSQDIYLCALVTHVFICLFAGHVSVPVSGYLPIVSHTRVLSFCLSEMSVYLSQDSYICVLVPHVLICLFAGHVSVLVSRYLHVC